MSIYEYMVVCSFKGGIGRVFISRDKEIKTREDILELDQCVRDLNSANENVFVTYFKLLETNNANESCNKWRNVRCRLVRKERLHE